MEIIILNFLGSFTHATHARLVKATNKIVELEVLNHLKAEKMKIRIVWLIQL